MATRNPTKNNRIARWERKHKRDAHDRKINEVLRDRKRQRKSLRGPEQITRVLTGPPGGKGFERAVAELWDAVAHTKLVVADHGTRPGYIDRHRSHLYGLAQLALRYKSWRRRPATWKPRSHNTDRRFCSLARHLLCEYRPPACMDSAWFEADKAAARRQQSWFIHVGRGGSMRTAAGLPVDLTRKAAHLFQSTPATLGLMEGLRWAQLGAMGGDARLIDALLASPMGTDFARDDFWLTVARFFIDHPMLDRAQVGPVVDYLHHHRHVVQPARCEDGRQIPAGPLQPALSMRGRAPNRLLAQVRQWHARLAVYSARQAYLSWKPTRIGPFTRAEGEGRSAKRYAVRELCDSRALTDEGRRMHHCVGSYDVSCHAGRSAIFAMSCAHKSEVKGLLTIEVALGAGQVVQARGVCNAMPSPDALRVLRIWAQEKGLGVGRGLEIG